MKNVCKDTDGGDAVSRHRLVRYNAASPNTPTLYGGRTGFLYNVLTYAQVLTHLLRVPRLYVA